MDQRDSNLQMERPQVGGYAISTGLMDISRKLERRLKEKGQGSYASKHEILGMFEEELLELKEAIRDDSSKGFKHFADELLDLAIVGLFGYICVSGGYIVPREE